MAEKTRYSDAELEEFRAIIMEKLELAQRDYEQLKMSLMGLDGNDTDDTSPTYKVLEEGANTLSKEETTRLAQRQLKFIQGLQAALVRIENKTYGICRETGKLIPAERLRVLSNPCQRRCEKPENRVDKASSSTPFFCLYKWNFILKITFSREKNMFGLRT